MKGTRRRIFAILERTVKPLCVIVTGDTVPRAAVRGDFVKLIRDATGSGWRGPWLAVDVRAGEPPPPLEEVSGLVITGSPSSVTERAPWMLATERYLRTAVERGTATLGICFGHQMLAMALGGHVEKNPRGREMGTVRVEPTADDPLLDGHAPPLLANTTHVDSVVEVPSGATVFARTDLDPYSGLRFAPRAWGVQFHPEIDGEVMRLYLEDRREVLLGEGHDPDQLLSDATDAHAGTAVLERFARTLVE